MRKLSKLLLGLVLLTLWSYNASGQTTTVLRDHYQTCASATTYDDQALDEGFPAGTWGPGDNPSAPPDRVFISHHGIRLRVPNNLTGNLSVKGIYLWFAPTTRVVGTADQFAFRIFRVNGNNLQPVGTKNFRLTDFANVGTATAPQDAKNYLSLNLAGINAGDELVFALETKTANSDDIITFYYTLPAGEAPCANIPSGWHVFLNDASNGQLLPGMPPLFDEFFSLKSQKTSEPVGGNPVFLPEIQSDPIQANTQTVCQGDCATLTPGAAPGATAYEWLPKTGLTAPTAVSTQACPRRDATYIRTARRADGTVVKTDTINVIVKEKPIATVVPGGPTQFCEGQSVVLRVDNPNPKWTFQWKRDGKDIGGATNASYTATETGLFTVEVDNEGCKRTSLATYVYVLPGVNFRVTGWPFMCGAGYTDLALKGDFTPEQQFSWSPSTNVTCTGTSTPLGGCTSSNVRIDFPANPATAQQVYTISATSAQGCTSTRRVLVRQSNTPTAISDIYDTLNYETGVATEVRNRVCSNEDPFIFRVGPGRPFGTLTWTPNIPGLITEVNDPDGENNQFLFDPSKVTGNNVAVNLTWSGNYHGCPFSATHRIDVTVVRIPTFTGVRDLVCNVGNTTINIGLASGGGPGGNWTLVRVDTDTTSVTNGFNTTATTATVNIATVGLGCYIVSYSNVDGNCPYTITRKFCIIGQNETATITGVAPRVCTSDGLKELVSSIPGGTFSGPGIVGVTVNGRANFDPSKVLVSPDDDLLSEKLVTINYNGTDGSCTLTGSIDVTVVRSNVSITGIPADNQICKVQNPFEIIIIPASVTVSCSGSQFIERNPNDPTKYIFDPSKGASGKYQLCFRGVTPEGCNINQVIEITVTDPPGVVQISPFSDPVCSNVPRFQLKGIPAGGEFRSINPGAVIEQDPAGVWWYNPRKFVVPDGTPIGTPFTEKITYFGRFGGCDYTIDRDMTVIYIPGVEFGGLEPRVCETDGIITIKMSPSGGSLVAPPGMVLERVTTDVWSFDTRKTPVGCYKLNYSGIAFVCTYSEDFQVCIDRQVDPATIRVQIGDNPPNPPFICSTAGLVPLIGLSPVGGTFSGVNVSDDGNGNYFLNPSTAGLTPAQIAKLGCVIYSGKQGGCSYSKEFCVRIDVVGEAIIGLPDTVCLNGVYPLVFSPSGGTAEILDEDSVFITTLTTGIFEPSAYTTVTPFNVKVRYHGTTPSGCAYDVTRNVTITDNTSSADLNGLLPAYCCNSGVVTITASPPGGRFFVKGGLGSNLVGELPLNGGDLDISMLCDSFGKGFYSLIYRGSANGCSVYAEKDFEIRSAPRVTLSANKTNLCIGNSAVMSVDPSDETTYSYTWYFQAAGTQTRVLINGATRPSYNTKVATPQNKDSVAGRYTVVVKELASGCETEATIQINVSADQLEWDDRDTETYAVGPTPTGNGGCNSDGYILATVKERYPGERFEFYVNGQGPFSSGLNFLEIYDALGIPVTGGKYTIRAVDAGGCEVETTLVVTSKCCQPIADAVIANVEPQNRSFTYTWNKLNGVIGYDLQIRKQGDTEWLPATPIRRLPAENSYDFGDNNPITMITGETYCVRVRSICDEDGSDVFEVSEWVEKCLVLTEDCPTLFSEISVANITTSSATVSWDAVPGVTGYRVAYEIIGNAGSRVEELAADANYTITNLIPNENYLVCVSTDCGAGLFSSESCNFFTTLDACPAPSGVKVDMVTTRSAHVTWDEVPGAITYEITYEQLGTGVVNSVATNGTSYDLDQLECGSSYVITIRNYCGGVLFSDFTGGEFFTTLPCCEAPNNVRSTGETASTIALEWDAVPSATSYRIVYKEQGSNLPAEEVMSFVPHVLLKGLKLTTPYDVEVYTICATEESAPFTGVFNTNDDCPSPINPEVGQTSPSTATISWLAPTGADVFIIEWATDCQSGIWSSQTVSTTSFTITGLDKGTTYCVRVRSQCSPGAESANVSTSFTTDAECGAPTNVLVTNVQPTTAQVTWTAGAGAQSYVVRYRKTAGGQWVSRTTTTPTILLASLDPSTEYEVQVRSVCGPVDVSVWATSVFFTTTNGLSCGIPTNLRIDNISATAARATWTAVPNATGYEVIYRAISETQFSQAFPATQTFRPLSGLTPGTDYRVKMRAVCGTVFGDYTAEVSFRTPIAKEGIASTESLTAYSVYPNPTKGDVNVSFTAENAGDITLTVVDVTGREVYRRTYGVVSGDNTLELPLNGSVTSGIYTLFFQNGDSRQTTKIVVE